MRLSMYHQCFAKLHDSFDSSNFNQRFLSESWPHIFLTVLTLHLTSLTGISNTIFLLHVENKKIMSIHFMEVLCDKTLKIYNDVMLKRVILLGKEADTQKLIQFYLTSFQVLRI